jgi:hypothetical protein
MAIDAASGLVIGSPEYQRFQDQREMAMQKASGLYDEPLVDAEAGTDNMQAMGRLAQADYSVGAEGSTYASGLAAAEEQFKGLPGTINPKISGDTGDTGDTGTVDTGDTGDTGGVGGKKVVSTIVNDKGENVAVYEDGTTQVLGQAVDKIAERKSAFDILKEEFTRYGLDRISRRYSSISNKRSKSSRVYFRT